MAYSNPIKTSHNDTTSLIECGICLLEMDNPKALPCLHSFCLNCLMEVQHPPGIFFCPLCQEKTILPKEGVSGFRDNFFINQLKDRKVISTKGKICKPCVSCEANRCDIEAHCVECKGFICQQCVKLHQMIAMMKVHTVFTVEELQSGRINMSKVMTEENCQKHKDQALRWFCKTCNTPICRDCTVMEHRHPDHDYTTIESANEDQVKEIKGLMEGCKGVTLQLTNVIANTEKVELNLTKSVDNIKKKMADEKRAYLDVIERSYKEQMDKLSQIQAQKAEKIKQTKLDLQNKKCKLDNAMQFADEVITSGSKQDLASNYSSLCKMLADLQQIKTSGMSKGFSNYSSLCKMLADLKQIKTSGMSKGFSEITIRPSQENDIIRVDLGSVSVKRKGKWLLEKEIGNEGEGKIKYGLGVAVDSNGDIYIADCTDKKVKIFESDGKYKRAVQGNLVNAHDVIMIPGETYLYITDRTGLVHLFNSQGENVKQFLAISPDGKASDTDGSGLYGLAVDNDGNILVGNYRKYYISKHKPDGTHISSFKTNICPWFITVTHQGRIIVSNQSNAEILNHKGKLLHTINKPSDTVFWHPCGICCSDDGIVYVTSYGKTNAGGIYSFKEDGTYLGCITTDVIQTQGIALIDDNRLVVSQYGGFPAKIFCYKDT